VYAPGGFSYPKTSSKAIGDFEDDGVVRIGPKTDASVVLGDWLSRLQEGDIKNTIIAAFGAQDEADIKDMPLGEQVFLELLSDLNPLMDIGPLIDN